MSGNVIKVPPRVKTITHKGMHGRIEFVPTLKRWLYKIKFLHTVELQGEASDEAHATLEVKKLIDKAQAGKNKNVRTTD